MLREWRCRRRLSQLELALKADVSSRHLSFVETGRSRPSAEMVLHLAKRLDVPLRERNDLLLAAGYAPAYRQCELDALEMRPVRGAIEQVLTGHEPYPAVVVDRHWGLVSANRALASLVEGAAAHLLEPPVNVLRLSLHPEGVAPRIVNLAQWRAQLLERLRRDALATGDPALDALHDELASYPGGDVGEPHGLVSSEVAVPLRLRARGGELSFIGTRTRFEDALDVTVGELSIESFFPTDERTADAMRTTARETRPFSTPWRGSLGKTTAPSPGHHDAAVSFGV
jgi:transcriptional regulator with XRE-family HTH domain